VGDVCAQDVVALEAGVGQDAIKLRARLADERALAMLVFAAPGFADDHDGGIRWTRGGPPKVVRVTQRCADADSARHSFGSASCKARMNQASIFRSTNDIAWSNVIYKSCVKSPGK